MGGWKREIDCRVSLRPIKQIAEAGVFTEMAVAKVNGVERTRLA